MVQSSKISEWINRNTFRVYSTHFLFDFPANSGANKVLRCGCIIEEAVLTETVSKYTNLASADWLLIMISFYNMEMYEWNGRQ